MIKLKEVNTYLYLFWWSEIGPIIRTLVIFGHEARVWSISRGDPLKWGSVENWGWVLKWKRNWITTIILNTQLSLKSVQVTGSYCSTTIRSKKNRAFKCKCLNFLTRVQVWFTLLATRKRISLSIWISLSHPIFFLYRRTVPSFWRQARPSSCSMWCHQSPN